MFRFPPLICLGYDNHCNLLCFFNLMTVSGLCQRLPSVTSSAEVLIFSLILSRGTLMPTLGSTFSKAVNMSAILNWYSFLTSTLLSFLRINLSKANLCVSLYLVTQSLLESPTAISLVDQTLHNSVPIPKHFLSTYNEMSSGYSYLY